MHHRTDGFYGINEALFSSALAAMVFSVFAVQPLTIVGITGLISLFNYTIFDIIRLHDVTIYPQFMVWVGIWAAVFHWLTALTNLCDYMRTVTDFSSQTFGLYVGTIYIIKGVEELIINFEDNAIVNGFASCLVAIMFCLTVYYLEDIGSTTLFRGWTRTLLSDYAYPIATIFWTGFTHIPGTLKRVDFLRLPVTRAFYPTVPRPWFVAFWTLEVKWIFVAIPFGLLMTLLFYYDHNVSSLTAQARHFPLKKPGGFHWDFFLLGWTCLIAGLVDIPLPNGLVPQAPVHTDALTDYTDHVREIENRDGAVLIRKDTTADRVAEQRISHFLMGLAIIGTMSGPLLVVLATMPRAIFAGVFFVVGWGSVNSSNGIIQKLTFLLREPRFQQPDDPLLQVPKRQVWHYVGWQLLGWGSTVAISQTIAAIGFPVLIVALIPLRWVGLPKIFTAHELQILDELTATNDVVLVSLGGKPEMPEVVKEKANANHTKKNQFADTEPGSGSSSGTRMDSAQNRDGLAARRKLGESRDSSEVSVATEGEVKTKGGGEEDQGFQSRAKLFDEERDTRYGVQKAYAGDVPR